jgi:predicted amidohydrolase
MKRRSHALKVGLGQMRVTMGNKRANLTEIRRIVESAGRDGCDILVLPECSLAGWLSAAAHDAAEAIPGPLTRKLSSAARKYRMAIVVGMEERTREERVFNAAVLVDPMGVVRLRHRKINELDIGLAIYARGNLLEVAELFGRTVAVSICADSWRPEVTDALYLMGARLIFSPSAWAVEPGGEATNLNWIAETYRQRAAERDLYIIAPNGVGQMTEGPWKGRSLQGNSLVIGPGGETLLRGPTGEPALLFFDLLA